MDIRSLAYVVVETTDLEKWQRFASDVLGMVVFERPEYPDYKFIRMDDFACRFIISKGSENRFKLAGWQLRDEDDYQHALSELTDKGIDFAPGTATEAGLRQVDDFVTLQAPGGIELELCHTPMLDYQALQSPAGVKEFITGQFGDMGLGHIAVATPDLKASYEFFTSVLGFGLTDYMHFYFNPEDAEHPGQGLRFLHCNNPRHHSIALYESDQAVAGNLVHLMVEVADMDELGLMMDRIRQHEVTVVTPLGRHTNDQMVSTYVESPSGFAIEVGFGGLQCDWTSFTPTRSARPSVWGHYWET